MDVIFCWKITGIIFFSYLIGSIPWGLLLTRFFSSRNILAEGSGNIGATNVRRLAGTGLGVFTLAGDVLKGAVPVLMADRLVDNTGTGAQIYISLVAMAAFLGHLFPVYLKFKNGGKGVATAAGCFLVISAPATIVTILTFILFVCISSRASAGSLAAAAILPLSVFKATSSYIFTCCAAATAVCIFLRHKDNIKRMLQGKEPPTIR